MLKRPMTAGNTRAAPTDSPVNCMVRLRATKKTGKNPWNPWNGFCARKIDPSSSSHMLQVSMFQARSRAATTRTRTKAQASREDDDWGGADGTELMRALGGAGG